MNNTQSSFNHGIELINSDRTQKAWQDIKIQMEGLLAEPEHFKWIESLEVLGQTNDRLYLKAKNRFESMWIKNHYQHLIDTLLELGNENLKSEIVIKE
jgi:chromosomal replication initiation ATPase DnaA